ncbi:hypothetical protein BB561_002009 [Smittium simulii]|uniref:Histone-lysine N-methyltransferase, H3 lysine-79 specific n=1 Tax=Smittium simulii TaxID=133385 RepID=A0A2T9YRZ8_9FUNG|nr:hypothetical protein BB561_002009 [Smittium simulii]
MNTSTVKFKVVERVVVRKKKRNSEFTTKTVSDHTISINSPPSKKSNVLLKPSQKKRGSFNFNSDNNEFTTQRNNHISKLPKLEQRSANRSINRINSSSPTRLERKPSPQDLKSEKKFKYADDIDATTKRSSSDKLAYSHTQPENQRVNSNRSPYTGDKTVPKINDTHSSNIYDSETLFSDSAISTPTHYLESNISASTDYSKVKSLLADKEDNNDNSFSAIEKINSYPQRKKSHSTTGDFEESEDLLDSTPIKKKNNTFSVFDIPICSASVILESNTKYNQYFNFEINIPDYLYEYYCPEMSFVKLSFPVGEYYERFSLLVPEQLLSNSSFLNEYNPISELITTVSTIGQLVENDSTIQDEILNPDNGILRLLEKGKNKKDALEFLKAIYKFNNIFKAKKVKFCNFKNSEMNFDITSNIFNQIYNRCITNHVEKLGKYRAFSNNVYGEINPALVDDFIKKCNFKPKDIFVDLGCGIGNVVIQTALQAGCASYGIEIMDIPAYLGQMQAKEYKARMRAYGLKRGTVEIIQGDFLENKYISEILNSSTIILVNNHAFDSGLNYRLMQMFLDLKEGTKIISLKSFGSTDFKINARNAGSLESILSVRKYSYWSDCVSWTSNPDIYKIFMSEQPEYNILTALDAWKGAGLAKLVLKHSEIGEEIIENQKSCLQSRKILAEKTKEFRKQSDEHNAVQFKILLKAYQNEIDSISKKMRFSENSLLSLINILSDLPDPEPFLTQMNEMSHSLATAAKQKQDILKLKNDNALLVRKLQKTKELETKNEQLKQQLEMSNKKMEEERDLQQQLSEAQHNLEILRGSHDMTQSELLQLSQNKDRALSTRVAEMEILQASLDRANDNMLNLQLQNSTLKSEILALNDGNSSNSVISELKNQNEAQESEISRLMEELEKSSQLFYSTEIEFLQKIEKLEQSIDIKDQSIESLKKKQSYQNDYNDIKRELNIIKSVEFSNIWDGEENENKNNNNCENEPLEKMLIKKNQHLQKLITSANNEKLDLNNTIAVLTKKNVVLSEDLKSKTSLVIKLENTLSSFDNNNLVNFNQKENKSTSSASDTLSQNQDQCSNQNTALNSSNKNLLAIVTSQRDRFRQRNSELELELRNQHTMLSELQSKLDKLESDNVGLYEQIRYLRSYSSVNSNNKNSGNVNLNTNFENYGQENSESSKSSNIFNEQQSHTSLSLNPVRPQSNDNDSSDINHSLGESSKSRKIYGNYQGIYEESISPFRKFKRSENYRRYRSMTFFDKTIWHMSRIFITRSTGFQKLQDKFNEKMINFY